MVINNEDISDPDILQSRYWPFGVTWYWSHDHSTCYGSFLRMAMHLSRMVM